MDQCKVNSQHIELSDLPTSETMLRVHSVESFGSVDGPGIRFVIFLKGCAMRCQYCHNPDTWDRAGGNLRSVDDVLSQALRYRSYWGEKGGITVSGGEALLQIQPLTELFHKAKDLGINTCQYLTCMENTLFRRRFHVCEFIRNAQLLPFIDSQVMIRQHFNTLHIA